VFIALLAVAFGVMSLITMTLVSASISRVLLVDPRYDIGGDAWLWRETQYLTPEDLAQIERYARAGAVERWAPVADSSTLLLKVPGSGRVTFLQDGVGFEPGSYPMVGEITLRSGAALADVLQRPEDIVITRDIADDRDVNVGDTVLIGNQLGGSAKAFRVAGIATETPAYHGSTAYYDLETAALLAGRPDPITNIAVQWEGNGGETRTALTASGWNVYAPDSMSERTVKMRQTFNLMLKGSGLLGLMVGGIGIANTMQVLLARRREEVAVLKTLGYVRGDILLIFVLETALIGLVGSLVGAVAGVGLSVLLVRVASNIVTLFITWHFDPWMTAAGIAVGVITTVLFAAHAILRASDVRPADVFRQLSSSLQGERRGRLGRRVRSLVTFGVMALPFGLIASLVLGSVWQGAAVLGAALVGLIVIGGTLAGIKWLAIRLLPVGRLHLLRLARNTMQRRGASMVFAMIALCIGTFTLGLSMIIIGGAQDQLDLQMYETEGFNLVVMTVPERAGEAEAAVHGIRSSKVAQVVVRYEAPLRTVTTGDGVDLARYLGATSLQGRDTPWDVILEGAPWGEVPGGAYLPAELEVAPETVVVTGFNGAEMTLPVVGTYAPTGSWDRFLLPTPEGILVSGETLRGFMTEDAFALVAAEVPVRSLEAAADEVGAALPEMMITTAVDINKSFRSTFSNLATFAIAMAGLALVAGAVLVANAVGMAMIERRYEIGILKAVGYTRGQVLRTILFEYGLVGAIAGAVGLLGVFLFITILTMVQDIVAGVLVMEIASSLLIVVVAVGLTVGAALAAAWQPSSLRPLVVLNGEGA
jgi:putative ABC transport system permease protein